MFRSLISHLKEFPEYFFALKGAVIVLAMGLPLYLGIRYFLYRRRLSISLGVTIQFFGTFLLFAGLAFILASPLSSYLPNGVITGYLFLTCIAAAVGVVSLVDVFLLKYYLVQVQRLYISPPLCSVIKLSIFVLAVLPTLRFVLHFNPLALVAIPTIATAAIAFALQDTLKSFIAGVTLGHMIRIGEWIAFDGREGRVLSINWGRTIIETIDGQRTYIPNSLLQSGVFLNYTTGNPINRLVLKINASYDTPPARVKEVLVQSLVGTTGVAKEPPPCAALLEYADSGITYGLYYWIEDYLRRGAIQDDVATRVWYAFSREDISIPYPKRTVLIERSAEKNRLERQRVGEELKRWSLAEVFYAEELEELARYTRRRIYAPGEIIVLQGDSGQSLFVILEGKADVFLATTGDKPVASLGAKDIFGEMSILTGEPRAATVRAQTSVEVLEIDKPGMQWVISRRPEISDKLAQLLTQHQAALTRATWEKEKSSVSKGSAESDAKLSQKIRQFFGLS